MYLQLAALLVVVQPIKKVKTLI